MPPNIDSSKQGFFSGILPQSLMPAGSDSKTSEPVQINQNFLWDLDFMNVGEIDFAIIGVYLEDPVTGERSCQQDGVYLYPCIDSRVNALKTMVFSLQFVSDFSVSEVRKTIVFESLDLIQRFPVRIEISPDALKIATEHVNSEVRL